VESHKEPIRKHDRSWLRTNKEKTKLFAEHLATVFTPNNKNNTNEEDVETFLNAPCQLSPPIRAYSPTEIRKLINTLNPYKAPGYDLRTGILLRIIPRKAIVYLTTLYNVMLRLCYIPVQWKYAQIIMIAKHGKPPTEFNSCRPISLLPILSTTSPHEA
jgi:hypothetical protein